MREVTHGRKEKGEEVGKVVSVFFFWGCSGAMECDDATFASRLIDRFFDIFNVLLLPNTNLASFPSATLPPMYHITNLVST